MVLDYHVHLINQTAVYLAHQCLFTFDMDLHRVPDIVPSFTSALKDVLGRMFIPQLKSPSQSVGTIPQPWEHDAKMALVFVIIHFYLSVINFRLPIHPT